MQNSLRPNTPSLAGADAVAHATTALVARLIDEMPHALRQRPLLSALDWGAVGSAQIQRLCDKLESAGRELPPWLSSLVVTAGHGVPEHIALRLPVELQALALMNRDKRSKPPEELERALVRRSTEGQLDLDATTVLIGRLASAGAGSGRSGPRR